MPGRLKQSAEVDGFLKAHGIAVQESLEEVERDSEQILALGRR
jgi:hypothetical protein